MTKVAIAKQENYNQEEVKFKLERILSDSGILELLRGKKVLIKPNCTGIFYPKEGRTTHPIFLEALVNILLELNANVVIGESSSVGVDTSRAYKTTGIANAAVKTGVELIDFKQSRYVEVKIDRGLVLEKTYIPQEVLETDYILSLAKMKTNYTSHISCSMKNMKGILPDSEKKRFHEVGLSKAIVDLNNYFNNVFGVVDGILTSELYEPIKANILVASKDVVACDAVCAKIMGLAPESVEYIKLAQATSRRAVDLSKLEIVGEQLSSVLKDFKNEPPSWHSLENKYGVKITPGELCSYCIGSLYLCLKKAKMQDPALLKDLDIQIGKQDTNYLFNDPLMFGNCAVQNSKVEDVVFGCPPTSLEFIEKITAKANKEYTIVYDESGFGSGISIPK